MTVIETASLPLLKVVGARVAEIFADLHRSHGVDFRFDAQVEDVTATADRGVRLTLGDGSVIEGDLLVVGVGVEPRTGLAERAGFRVESSTYWNTLPFPLVVARRKVMRVRPKAGDVRMYPAPLEAIFNAMMSVERRWLGSVGRLPFGSSVLMMARRPEE